MANAILSIRSAIVERLRGRTSAGDTVSTNRADRVWASNLPAIVVYTLSERYERIEQETASYDCTLSVSIDVLAQDDDGLPMDDVIDSLAVEVRDLLAADPRFQAELGALVTDARIVSYDVTVEAGGERLIAGGRLVFEFVYHYEPVEGDPGQLAPLKRVGASISLDENDLPPV